MSFADLKRNREKMFQNLNKQMEQDKGGRQKDDRIWYPAVDQAGNGYAEIRFLPAPGDEPCPYVKVYNHGFKGPRGWYIENSLTTLGKDDFVSEENQRLWNVEDKVERAANQAAIKGSKKNPGRKRNLNYFANVYIVNDPANPENNGQVKLFRYGAKIHEKLMEAMQPDPLDPDAKQINPFDLFGPDPKNNQPGGANFKLKIRNNAEGFRSYEKSTFADPAPLFADEDEMEAVWKKAYSLQDIIAPDKFKSYEELKARYLKIMGLDGRAPVSGPTASEPEPTPLRIVDEPKARNDDRAPWEDQEDDNVSSATADDDDTDLNYFRQIAES